MERLTPLYTPLHTHYIYAILSSTENLHFGNITPKGTIFSSFYMFPLRYGNICGNFRELEIAVRET